MENLIVFRAYNSKRQNPVKLSPLEDKSGRLYTGQGKYGYYELLSEEEKKTLPFVIDHETVVSLESGDTLNLENPVDAANWEWIKKHPYIALDEETGRSSRDAVLYVDNPERKAEIHVSKDKKVTMAKAKIYAASNARKVLLAKALANPGADSMQATILEEWLITIAEKSPNIINGYLDDKKKEELEIRAFIEELKLYSLLIRFAGTWKYGGSDGIIVGNDNDECVSYVLDKKNEENVFVMREKLKELKTTK